MRRSAWICIVLLLSLEAHALAARIGKDEGFQRAHGSDREPDENDNDEDIPDDEMRDDNAAEVERRREQPYNYTLVDETSSTDVLTEQNLKDAMSIYFCVRMVTSPDFVKMPLRCSTDLRFVTAPQELDDAISLFSASSQWYKDGVSESSMGLLSDYLETTELDFAKTRVGKAVLNNVEPGKVRDGMINHALGEANKRVGARYGEVLNSLPVEAVITPSPQLKIHRWDTRSRFLICAGEKQLFGSPELSTFGCLGFLRAGAAKGELVRIKSAFAEPGKVDEVVRTAMHAWKATESEVTAVDVSSATANDVFHSMVASIASPFRTTAIHVAEFYSIKIAVLVAGLITGLAVLEIIGMILLVPLPYVVYKLSVTGHRALSLQRKQRLISALFSNATSLVVANHA